MTDEEKYAPERILIDRVRTSMAIRAWNLEARRRLRVDIYDRLTGRQFTGTVQDPNAARIVAAMQKDFLLLSRQRGVTVSAVPCIRENSPYAVGLLTCDEEQLDGDGRLALRRLREISDDVSVSGVNDGQGSRRQYRFLLGNVWSECIRRGHSYDEWLKLTYGKDYEKTL